MVREAVKEWLDAQRIQGIDEIRRTLLPISDFDDNATQNDLGCACFIYIEMGEDYENRAALVGPNNPGGKEILYEVRLMVRHRGFDQDDWEGSQRDYNRIVDALKDCLRARGRDLGRADAGIIQAGDWPSIRGIVHSPGEAIDAGGMVDRWGQVSFQVTQYLATFVPSEPA